MSLRGLHLHVDCASGAAGDMMLGALIDLGVPIPVIGEALDAIGAGRQRLGVARVVKGGIAAVDVTVDTREAAPPSLSASGSFVAIKFRAETHERHVHVDEHGDKIEHVHVARAPTSPVDDPRHGHHRYADIRKRITAAKLADGTRRRALDIFDRLARAEAKLHGVAVDEVAFHEVGAIDSIVDIVGTAAALDWLAPAAVTCAAPDLRAAIPMQPLPAARSTTRLLATTSAWSRT